MHKTDEKKEDITVESSENTKESETIFEVKNLSYSYNDDKLANVSLTINRGETIALAGMNGSGKSTLVKFSWEILSKFKRLWNPIR